MYTLQQILEEMADQTGDKLRVSLGNLPVHSYVLGSEKNARAKLDRLRASINKMNAFIEKKELTTINKKVASDYKKAQVTLDQIYTSLDNPNLPPKKFKYDDLLRLTNLYNFHVYIGSGGTRRPGREKQASRTIAFSTEGKQQEYTDFYKENKDSLTGFKKQGGLIFQHTGHGEDSSIAYFDTLENVSKISDPEVRARAESIVSVMTVLDSLKNYLPRYTAPSAGTGNVLARAMRSKEFKVNLTAKKKQRASISYTTTDITINISLEDSQKNKITGNLMGLWMKELKRFNASIDEIRKVGEAQKQLARLDKELARIWKKYEKIAPNMSGSKTPIKLAGDVVEEMFLTNKVTPKKSSNKYTADSKFRNGRKKGGKSKSYKKFKGFPQLRTWKGQFTNTTNIQSMIQLKLAQQIKGNMAPASADTSGALRNITGRFAHSVRVANVTPARGAAINIYYSYKKNPYDTFAQGGNLYTSKRDVEVLIEKSIRQLAIELVLTKLKLNIQEI